MKENKTSTTANGGIDFCDLLTIVFIVLKLLGKITWSWIWVLAPMWIELVIVVLIYSIIGILMIKRKNK